MIRILAILLSVAAMAALSGTNGTRAAASRMPQTTAARVQSGEAGWTGAPAYRLAQYWRHRHEEYGEGAHIGYRELEQMAYALQDAASRAHDHARESFHADNFQGSRKGADEALARYKDLKDSARAFYDQVVKYHGDLGHIDEEYRRVAHDYYEARDRSTHYGFPVEANLDRVGQLINQLRFVEEH